MDEAEADVDEAEADVDEADEFADIVKYSRCAAVNACACLARTMPKRFLSDEEERASLRGRLLAKMASLMARSEDEVAAAVAAKPSATLLDLGLTSAMGVSIKGWIFHELEAELTSFQCLKQPFDAVVEAIEGAQRQALGTVIPDLGAAPSDAAAAAANLTPVSISALAGNGPAAA